MCDKTRQKRARIRTGSTSDKSQPRVFPEEWRQKDGRKEERRKSRGSEKKKKMRH
jgi:hypothetical protein